MRCGHLLLLAAGCGFHGPELIPDGGVAEMRNFDLAALRAGQLLHMTVDGSRSSLTPDAYTYGGLIAHGLAGTKLWNHGDTAWSKLATVSPNGAGLWRGESFTTGDKLDYLGVANDSTGTLWLEGEIWLDASSGEVFGITADDVAFVDLAPPNTTAYARAIENTVASMPVDTPESGWYPIRIGFANEDGSYGLNFTHSEMGSMPAPWPRDRLRARASELSGTLRTVFGHRLLGGGQGTQRPVMHVEPGSLLATTSFGTPLQGVAPNNDLWSARYFGQVYIDQPGMYGLRVDSDDGDRAQLDTGHDETGWGSNGRPGNSTAMAQLSQGWADLFVDYDQVGGSRSLRVQLQRPDKSMVEISPDHLRPVESSTDRLVSSSDDAQHTITDNGGAGNPGVATFSVAGYQGETVGAIDVVFFVSSPHSDQLKADLETPAGTRVQIRNRGAGIDAQQGAQATILSTATDATATLLNGPAKGAWKLDVYDDDSSGGGGNSTLLSAKLTLHTKGGPDKVARTAQWKSAVIDATSNVFAVDAVSWKERVPAGGSVEVHFAACGQADCSDASWSSALTKGMQFAVAPSRYLQLRVDMTSDGSHEPEIQELALMFRRAP
ncbi:MAG TPA: proprotein convertase P-domain-containing protein [Kofleriaceae bacterium]